MLEHCHVIWRGSFSRCPFTAPDNIVDELSYLGEQRVLFPFQNTKSCNPQKHPETAFSARFFFFRYRTWVSCIPGDLALSCTLPLPNCLMNDWSVAGLKMNHLTWFSSALSDTIQLTGQTPILSTLRLENKHRQFRIKARKWQQVWTSTENTSPSKCAGCRDGGLLSGAESCASCREWQRARGSTIRKCKQQYGPCHICQPSPRSLANWLSWMLFMETR